jgi:choline dehydrogenase
MKKTNRPSANFAINVQRKWAIPPAADFLEIIPIVTYDFVIVGAGSAGCVLAERLSASGRNRVLLLEAGGSDWRFYVQMPLGYGKTFYDPAINWMYRTEPDPGLNGQSDYWPRGKILGGSSSINAMVYVRGNAADFEDWKSAGNPGWGWREVLAAYRAMEDNEQGGNEWRGIGGPLFIRRATLDHHPLIAPFIAATEKTGLKFNADFNGAEQEGVGTFQLTIKNGRRNSAARAFLRPALKRGNLRIETGALVTRVLFEGNVATAVEYEKNGQVLKAMAGREVILAGGAVNSPQLLQLSGVGPGRLLQDHGITPLIANENVGANLTDHQGLNYTYRMKVPTMNEVLRPWWGKLRVGIEYLLRRTGPLAISINHAGGFFRTDPTRTRPNMQLYMQAFSTLIPKEGERPLLTPDPFPGMSLGLSNCHPTSRGTITIRSANPHEKPKIVGNVYATDNDIEEMLLAVKYLRRIAALEPLKSLIDEELRPGPQIRSDEDLVHDIRQRSGTVYHPCCTCRMGPDPATAVVDARLRVHGLRNLRVCDASVFPAIPAGNLNAPAMMVGWRGAQIILGED